MPGPTLLVHPATQIVSSAGQIPPIPLIGGRRRDALEHTSLLGLSAVCDKFLRELLPGLRSHVPVSCSAPHLMSTVERSLFHRQVRFRRYPSLGGRRRGALEHTSLLDLSAVCDECLRIFSPRLRRHVPVSCSAPHLISTLERSLFHPQVRFRRYPSLGERLT